MLGVVNGGHGRLEENREVVSGRLKGARVKSERCKAKGERVNGDM